MTNQSFNNFESIVKTSISNPISIQIFFIYLLKKNINIELNIFTAVLSQF
jgi:hypothetical protein